MGGSRPPGGAAAAAVARGTALRLREPRYACAHSKYFPAPLRLCAFLSCARRSATRLGWLLSTPEEKLLGGMLHLPRKRCGICVDCTSLITVPILTDREIYRHNSNYLKLCKTSGPPVILALPEATLFRGPLEEAFRGLRLLVPDSSSWRP